MADFSHLAMAYTERETAMAPDERAARDAGQRQALERLAKQHERLMAPMRTIQDALNSPAIRLARQWSASPIAQLAQDLVNSPMARLAKDYGSIPELKAAEDLSARLRALTMPSVQLPMLASMNRLVEGVDCVPSNVNTHPVFQPSELLHPIRRLRDVDQDEHFARLTSEVVAQTEQVVELRREVREVKHSASRNAHLERVQTMRLGRAGIRIQWWHLLLSALLGAATTRLLDLI